MPKISTRKTGKTKEEKRKKKRFEGGDLMEEKKKERVKSEGKKVGIARRPKINPGMAVKE